LQLEEGQEPAGEQNPAFAQGIVVAQLELVAGVLDSSCDRVCAAGQLRDSIS